MDSPTAAAAAGEREPPWTRERPGSEGADGRTARTRERLEDDEARIMERLRTMGPCPAGYSWFRQGNGWRCAGGQHFVYDDDPILTDDL